MKKKINLIIFTDLDGSLLHRETFQFESIRSYIHKLINFGIILIPNSSKTIKELELFNIELKKNSSSNKLRNELIRYYKNDSFIKIAKLNSELGSGNVLNTNYCEISVCETRLKNKIVIFSAIDNLIKGASGQAIQNMNLIYKIPESIGLK